MQTCRSNIYLKKLTLRNTTRRQIFFDSQCHLIPESEILVFIGLKYKSMNIIEFINHFPNEESCDSFLKVYRENCGIYCKTCESKPKQYWFSGKKFFECSKSRRRTSLKAGTVMESSKLPLHTRFTAFLLMSATKKGFPCLEFQRQLGLKRFETAFNLMHKIRL